MKFYRDLYRDICCCSFCCLWIYNNECKKINKMEFIVLCGLLLVLGLIAFAWIKYDESKHAKDHN